VEVAADEAAMLRIARAAARLGWLGNDGVTPEGP
jgi:hypothetical protein